MLFPTVFKYDMQCCIKEKKYIYLTSIDSNKFLPESEVLYVEIL